MNKVILDANILYSNVLRGLFLWLAKLKFIEPIWSSQIWDEVSRNRPGTDEDRKKFKVGIENQMQKNFGNSMRTLPDTYSVLGLPDKDDEHIIALAIKEQVSTVLTFNLKDFPDEIVSKVGVKCIHPDVFLSNLYNVKKTEINDVVRFHIQNLTVSKPSKAKYFESLKGASINEFACHLEVEESKGNLFPEIWA